MTLLDQSPHQLAPARAQAGARRRARSCRGDAEELPFATDSADRYVSAGSIEYWPDPQRGIAEAYRVLRPGGIAMLVGPVLPGAPARRAGSRTRGCCSRPRSEYRAWFAAAGFADVEVRPLPRTGTGGRPFAVAVAGRKPAPGASPVALARAASRPTRR